AALRTVGWDVAAATLFTALPASVPQVTAALQGLHGSFNLQDGSLTVQAQQFTASLGGLLDITARATTTTDPATHQDTTTPGVTLSYSPSAAPGADLVRIGQAVAQLTK